MSETGLEKALPNHTMDKKELLEIIRKILKTEADTDMDFLLQLSESDLKILVGGIRTRLDQLEK